MKEIILFLAIISLAIISCTVEYGTHIVKPSLVEKSNIVCASHGGVLRWELQEYECTIICEDETSFVVTIEEPKETITVTE